MENKIVALVETNECSPLFCSFAGLVELPSGLTIDDVDFDALYEQWQAESQDETTEDEFTRWLVVRHGWKELDCGFAILGD